MRVNIEFEGFCSVTLKSVEFVNFKHVFLHVIWKNSKFLVLPAFEHFWKKKTLKITPYYNLSGANYQIWVNIEF